MSAKNYMVLFTESHLDEYELLKETEDKEQILLGKSISEKLNTTSDLKELDKLHGVDIVCQKVVQKFNEFYKCNIEQVKVFTKLTKRETNASYYMSDKSIIIDPLLIDGLHNFFVICYIWEDFMYSDENIKVRNQADDDNASFMNDVYFKYFTTIFYAFIKDKALCNIYKFKYVLEQSNKIGESALFNLITSCQFCATYFCVAHECAHAYFDINNITFDSDDIYSAEEYEEFEADKYAYKLIIELIKEEEQSGTIIGDRELFNYSYLAPMMLINFFIAYFTVEEKIYPHKNVKLLLNNAENRLRELMKYYYFYYNEYDFPFETEGGNAAYNGILNSLDKYKEMLEQYDKNGKLSVIFNTLDNC